MKAFFIFKSSRSRMVMLWFVDVLTIVANSYLALFLRVMDGAIGLGDEPDDGG